MSGKLIKLIFIIAIIISIALGYVNFQLVQDNKLLIDKVSRESMERDGFLLIKMDELIGVHNDLVDKYNEHLEQFHKSRHNKINEEEKIKIKW